jgi:RHS repeat-associated protein
MAQRSCARFTSGTMPTSKRSLPRTYTNQRSEMDTLGLMFYQARFYDPSLGRFAQADSIVPGGVQGLDRYAYVFNSPLNLVDPSGHNPECGPDGVWCDDDPGNDNDYPSMPLPGDDELFEYIESESSPDVVCLQWCQNNPNIRERTYERYRLLRKALFDKFGFGLYVSRDGRISDQALLAIIRLGEFGNSGHIFGSVQAYNESMEALVHLGVNYLLVRLPVVCLDKSI